MGIIYKLANKINGKVYIGQTLRNLNNRMAEHLYKSRNKSNIPIYNAIRKYGFNSFDVSVIDNGDNVKTLNEKETFWIMKLGTLHPLGYNMKAISENHICSDETRRKIGIKSVGRYFSKESRYRMGSWRGKKRPEHSILISKIQKGRKMSEITKRKISESHKGMKYSNETKIKLSNIMKERMKNDDGFRNLALSNLKH